eukprot:CFRG1209T1
MAAEFHEKHSKEKIQVDSSCPRPSNTSRASKNYSTDEAESSTRRRGPKSVSKQILSGSHEDEQTHSATPSLPNNSKPTLSQGFNDQGNPMAHSARFDDTNNLPLYTQIKLNKGGCTSDPSRTSECFGEMAKSPGCTAPPNSEANTSPELTGLLDNDFIEYLLEGANAGFIDLSLVQLLVSKQLGNEQRDFEKLKCVREQKARFDAEKCQQLRTKKYKVKTPKSCHTSTVFKYESVPDSESDASRLNKHQLPPSQQQNQGKLVGSGFSGNNNEKDGMTMQEMTAALSASGVDSSVPSRIHDYQEKSTMTLEDHSKPEVCQTAHCVCKHHFHFPQTTLVPPAKKKDALLSIGSIAKRMFVKRNLMESVEHPSVTREGDGFDDTSEGVGNIIPPESSSFTMDFKKIYSLECPAGRACHRLEGHSVFSQHHNTII